MKGKLIALFLALGVAAAVGTLRISSQSKQEQLLQLDAAEDRGTIPWYIRKARVKGEKQVVFPAPIIEYPEVKDIDEALRDYDVVVAQPIERITYAHDYGLVTWYKFRILRRLSTKGGAECPHCGSLGEPPAELLPVNNDEVLAPEVGGRVTSDGTTVIQPTEFLAAFSNEFSVITKEKSSSHQSITNSPQYLLFLQPSSDRRMARLPIGPAAMFSISSVGELEAVDNQPNMFKTSLEKLQLSSVENVVEHIRYHSITK